MKRVDINLNGRNYAVACEEGQEDRVMELADMVQSKLKAISVGAPSANDAHLLALTALVLADEAERASEAAADAGNFDPDAVGAPIGAEDEELLVAAIEHLTTRINGIADSLAA